MITFDRDEAYQPKRWRVYILEDRWDEDSDRRWITVPRAIGHADVRNQVALEYPGASILGIEEVLLEVGS